MSSPTNAALNVARAQARLKAMKLLGTALGACGLAALGLFFWQASSLTPPKPEQNKAADLVQNPEQISSQQASIAGRDGNNRPFEIKAKSGQQDKAIENLVHMQQITGVFERPTGAKLDLASAEGTYDSKVKSLELQGNVVFKEGTRFQATMDKALINTVDQSLQSKTPVKVDMQGTLIEAGSLTVTENGARVLFKGGVKAQFKMKNMTTGDGG